MLLTRSCSRYVVSVAGLLATVSALTSMGVAESSLVLRFDMFTQPHVVCGTGGFGWMLRTDIRRG